MLLPPRRKPVKSGIARVAWRIWPRHKKFVRSHHCVCEGCIQEPIEVSHIRTAANAGTGMKPHDWFSVPMCRAHHAEYHRVGHQTFEGRYRLNLAAIAALMAHTSPDTAMKEAMAGSAEE